LQVCVDGIVFVLLMDWRSSCLIFLSRISLRFLSFSSLSSIGFLFGVLFCVKFEVIFFYGVVAKLSAFKILPSSN
jgi:hypothetical protein